MSVISRLKRSCRGIKQRISKDPLCVEKTRIYEADRAKSNPGSVLFFTTHKCASMFCDTLFGTISRNSRFECRNYPAAFWELEGKIQVGDSYEPFLIENYNTFFRQKGEIYAPLRRPIDFPGRNGFKHIFFLRDPRDVLVSAFYSFGFTHSLGNDEERKSERLKEREKIQTGGIDVYALKAGVEWLLPIYEKYRSFREEENRSLYLRYDEFAHDTKRFLTAILEFLDVNLPEDAFNTIVDKAAPVQARPRDGKHKRSGKTGQYQTELKPDTIEFLNEKLSAVLDYWGFPGQVGK